MIIWLIDSIASGQMADSAGAAHDVALRALAAAAIVALLTLCFGPAAIRWLARHFREPMKSGSAELDRLHRAKQSTPTMGGIFIVVGVALAVLAVGDITNRAVLLALVVTAGLALLGAIDDLVKLRTRATGLGWKTKLLGQMCVAAIPAVCFYRGWCVPADEALLLLPGASALTPSWLIVPWVMLVIVGTSNAANLTDGLDGLAAGCLIVAIAAIGIVTYACVDGPARALVVVAGSVVGALAGFLQFNRHPARVFMGNVGALSMGGLLGFLAVATGTEMLLPLIGGVFVAESLSVLLQIVCYRAVRKRVLRCSPWHHHFEFLGWPETKIVRRFWIAATACAVAGVTLALVGRAALQSMPAAKAPVMATVSRLRDVSGLR